MSAPLVSCAAPEDRAALTRLWKRVFGDPDDYLALFFEHRFSPGQALVARAAPHPEPVAMLFLLPIAFCSGARRYEGRYIYAVATDPDFRSRGLSSLLLDEAHRRLAAEGLSFSALVPAEPTLFCYYGARGFTTEFYRREALISPDPDCGRGIGLTPASLPELLPLRDALFGASALYGRWDRAALAYQQRETALLGGETLFFTFDGKPGYAVCHPAGELVLVKEWGFPSAAQPVFSAIAQRYGRGTLRLDLPAAPGGDGARPFAMTRWYSQERKCADGSPPVLSLVLD